MHEVYILSAARTPIGKFGGSLASISVVDMGVVAVQAALERAAIRPDQIEETIFGNARQAGGGPNPARQITTVGVVTRLRSGTQNVKRILPLQHLLRKIGHHV